MKDSYAVLPFFHFSWRWGVISKTSRWSRTWKQSFVQLVSVKDRLTSCLLVGTGKKSPGRDDEERWPGKAGSRTIPFNFPFLEVWKTDSTCAGTFQDYGPSEMDEVGIGLRGPSQQGTKSLPKVQLRLPLGVGGEGIILKMKSLPQTPWETVLHQWCLLRLSPINIQTTGNS